MKIKSFFQNRTMLHVLSIMFCHWYLFYLSRIIWCKYLRNQSSNILRIMIRNLKNMNIWDVIKGWYYFIQDSTAMRKSYTIDEKEILLHQFLLLFYIFPFKKFLLLCKIYGNCHYYGKDRHHFDPFWVWLFIPTKQITSWKKKKGYKNNNTVAE